MRRKRTFAIIMLAAAACAATPALAQGGATGPVLDGAVAHPGPLDTAALAKLATASLPVVQLTGHGISHDRADGTLLWDVLQQAGTRDEAAKHASLRHTVMVFGRDGYQVAFSFGELDPGGSGDPVLLIRSGDQFGLVVPGDRTAARDVHDVVRITVH